MRLSSILGLVVLTGLSLFAPAARAQNEKPEAPKTEQPKATPTENVVYVTMKTSMGDITLELNKEKAPVSTDNFLAYADKKFYDGTVFHRVVALAGMKVIQGGGFNADMSRKNTDKAIKNEWQNGLSNQRGTIAMARLGGNADSATSQFYINGKDNLFLDEPRDGAGYAVFGKVVEGMDVVDKIQGVKTGVKGGMPDVPVESVTIKECRRLTSEEITALKGRLGKK